MKAADTPADSRVSAHRINRRSGERKMPPPTPVSPESRPINAPQAIAARSGTPLMGSLLTRLQTSLYVSTRHSKSRVAPPCRMLKFMSRPSLSKLGWIFIRYGNFIFGRGTATITVIDRELIERRGMIRPDQARLSFALAH